MILANSIKRLVSGVHLQTDATKVAAGVLKFLIRLEQPGNADDKFYWDHTLTDWVVGEPILADLAPATHEGNGQWFYDLPAAATLGKGGGKNSIRWSVTNELDETLDTLISESGEHVIFPSDPTNHAASALAIAGGSTTEVRTDATEADGFYDGLVLLVVNTAGIVAREISGYLNVNGAFTVTPALPFTPAANDAVVVMGVLASSSIDVGSIADAVWEEPIADHSGTVGSTAEKLNEAAASAAAAAASVDDAPVGIIEDSEEIVGTMEDSEEIIGDLEE